MSPSKQQQGQVSKILVSLETYILYPENKTFTPLPLDLSNLLYGHDKPHSRHLSPRLEGVWRVGTYFFSGRKTLYIWYLSQTLSLPVSLRSCTPFNRRLTPCPPSTKCKSPSITDLVTLLRYHVSRNFRTGPGPLPQTYVHCPKRRNNEDGTPLTPK